MATTKQDTTTAPDPWEQEQLALVAAEGERRRQAAEAAQAKRRWEEEDRARYAELIGPETARVSEQWEAERLRALRQRAEVTAGRRIKGQILAAHARQLTGPYSAEVLANQGLTAVGHAWGLDCPAHRVPTEPDRDWLPVHIRLPWILKDDGIYRRFHTTTMSIPHDAAGPLLQVGYLPNKTVTGDPLEYWVAEPVWPLGVGRGAASFAVKTGGKWKVLDVTLGRDVDVSAAATLGVKVNPAPATWTEIGAATGDRTPRRISAAQLLSEFLDAARRQTPGAPVPRPAGR